jgi:hypothetical protein
MHQPRYIFLQKDVTTLVCMGYTISNANPMLYFLLGVSKYGPVQEPR